MRQIDNRIFTRKQGMPPGSLIGGNSSRPMRFRHLRYSEDLLEDKTYTSIAEIPALGSPGIVDWIQVIGADDSHTLVEAGRLFGLHHLTMEDIQNTDRRLGFEDRDDYLFFTLKRITKLDNDEFVGTETVTLIMKDSFILTFHQEDSDGYPDLVSRIENRSGRLRKSDASYLAYVIIDESIDTWLSHSASIENGLLKIEEDVLFHYKNELISQIHQWKKHLAWLRWLFQPYRDLNSWLFREGAKWFPDDVRPYLSDVSDHVTRVLDTLELYREMVEGLLTVHMTALSNRMNNIVKMLTIISTIFIPMTFLTGLYGMNFDRMPELAWKWGYPAVLGLMLIIAVLMIGYFKRKKWL